MPEPITPERIAEIRQRAEAATPGPWKPDFRSGCCAVYEKSREQDSPGCHFDLDRNIVYSSKGAKYNGTHWDMDAQTQCDFAFIAHAREDVPDLLAEVERLQARVAALEAEKAVPLEVAEIAAIATGNFVGLLPYQKDSTETVQFGIAKAFHLAEQNDSKLTEMLRPIVRTIIELAFVRNGEARAAIDAARKEAPRG